jgi:diacylglycerol kinase (ATP)
MKPFIVANPVAGNADTDEVRRLIDQHLPESDREIFETTGEEKISEVVAEALERGFDLIVAAGGDGTVSGVAAGLVNQQVPMAILPIGTGNALARELGIPLNLEEAIQLMVGDFDIRAIDGMWVKGWLSVLSVGIGITSMTMQETGREQKRRFGLLAYLWTGLLQLSGLSLNRFELEIDGKIKKVRASEVFISNSRVVGVKPFNLGEDVRPDDGEMAVCVVRARTAWDYVRVVAQLATGQRRSKEIDCEQARQKVKVSASRELPIQADGEVVGSTPVEVQVVPTAVRVVVPKDSL